MRRTPARILETTWLQLAAVLRRLRVSAAIAWELGRAIRALHAPGPSRPPRYPALSPEGRHLDTRNTLTGAIITKFSYDSGGLLTSEADGDGNVLTIQRNSSGAATAIVAPGGQATTLAMDENGYLASATDPGGHTHDFTYSPGGLLLSQLSPKRGLSSYAYDPLGRVTKDTDPERGTISVGATELATGIDVVLTTAGGRQALRQLRMLPDGSIHQKLIGPTGAATTAITASDGTVATTYPDGLSEVSTKVTDPRWGAQSLTLSTETVSTPGGLTYAAQASRTVSLATPAQPLSLSTQTDLVSANGAQFTTRYDATSQTITLGSPAGLTETTSLDSQARPLAYLMDPTGSVLSLHRDLHGNITSTQFGDRVSSYAYDAAQRLVSVTDAQGASTQFSYQGADLLQSMTMPSGGQFGFGYDPNDNLTSFVMPSQAAHVFSYNGTDLPISYTAPSAPSEITSYTADREIASVALPSGRTIAISYDSGGRLSTLAYPEASVHLSYADATSRLSGATSSAGGMNSTTYAYDGPLLVQMTMTGQANGQYRYRYDNSFQVAGYTLDANPEIGIQRDADGCVIIHGPFTFTRGGLAGSVSKISDGVLTVSYTCDSSGRLTTRSLAVAGQQVYEIDLAYNSADKIVQRTEITSAGSHTTAYGYDSEGRLVQAQVDGVLSEQYSFDANEDRTSRQVGSLDKELATYDVQDCLLTRGSITYKHNADGQTIARGSDSFVYTAQGELTDVVLGTGASVHYTYDASGWRVSRADASGVTQYLYGLVAGATRITATRNPAGVATQFFYDEMGNVFAFQRGGTWFYVATDQVGSARAITDAQGNIVRAFTYDGFGVIASDSNPAFEYPFGFAGGLADPVSGLVRFGFRDYEPASGRWMSADPTKVEGGLNRYWYVGYNPVSKRDLTGLAWKWEEVEKILRDPEAPEGGTALFIYNGNVLNENLAPALDGVARCGNHDTGRAVVAIADRLNPETAAGVFVHEAHHIQRERQRLGGDGHVSRDDLVDEETESALAELAFHRHRMKSHPDQAKADRILEMRCQRLRDEPKLKVRDIVESTYTATGHLKPFDYHYKNLHLLVFPPRK